MGPLLHIFVLYLSAVCRAGKHQHVSFKYCPTTPWALGNTLLAAQPRHTAATVMAAPHSLLHERAQAGPAAAAAAASTDVTYGACSTQTCRVSCSMTRHAGKRRAAQVVVLSHMHHNSQYTQSRPSVTQVEWNGTGQAPACPPPCLPACGEPVQHARGWLLGAADGRALRTRSLAHWQQGCVGRAHRLHVRADLGTVSVHQQAPPPGSLPRVGSCRRMKQGLGGMSAALVW